MAESFVVGRGRRCDLPTQAALREVLRQGRGEPLQLAVDLVAGDHQRRGDADRVLMGILGEDALALERLAVAACAPGLRLQFDSQHQSAPAYLAASVATDVFRAVMD